MSDTPPLVTLEDERPNGKGSGHCFYCPSKIGERHSADCVRWERTVTIRMILEYPVKVPHSWDKDDIEFHRNDGTWCGDNAVQELEQLPDDFICQHAKFEYVGEGDDEPVGGQV